MRASLVVNPKATTTSPLATDVLLRALGSELKLDVAATEGRGHAFELGRQAAEDGLDLLVVLGGDGTVNEALNGLLAHGPSGAVPALAVVPSGSANVFARALGLPRDPVEATGTLLAALREGRRRRIGLGRADDRWFACCAGLGLDAEVIRAVELRRADGEPATPALYLRTAVRHFWRETDRRAAPLQLHRPGLPPLGPLALAIVSNTSPWTYFGSYPLRPTPQASFDTRLDLLALRRAGTAPVLRSIRRMLLPGSGPRGRSVVRAHDADAFRITADRPVALQVDGDYLGTTRSVSFHASTAALTVVA